MCKAGTGRELRPDPERAIAEPNTLLRVEVGSTVHGVSVDGLDDRDEMGVCCEPPHYLLGFGRFEQWVYRDAVERYWLEHGQGPGDAPKSGPGDLDLTVYSLRKWCGMAMSGNPSAILLLHSPIRPLETPLGTSLRELAPAFASKRIGRAYMHYLRTQRERLTGERGQRDVNRPELVEKYGFDTKFAYHVLRLGYQGLEYLFTGALVLPIAEPVRSHLLDVRHGKLSLLDVLTESKALEEQLQQAIQDSPLPDDPATELIDEFVVDAYRTWWGWQPEQPVRRS
jgi:hypothetical protein